MSEDWSAIAAEVAAAISDLGLTAIVSRDLGEQETPWDTARPRYEFTATIIDSGIQNVRAPGSSERVARRVVMMGATEDAPQIGDRLTLREAEHEVLAVYATAPGGTDLVYRVELST